ncbi:hypothetical protein V8F06_001488 [Rhypophila decipiens]
MPNLPINNLTISSYLYADDPVSALSAAEKLSDGEEKEKENLLSDLTPMLKLTDQKVDAARERVNIVKHLQRYRPSLHDVAEYYPVGHDVPDSLLDEPLFKRLGLSIENMKLVPKTNTKDRDVSFLFCGIGDDRHMFATIIGSGAASRNLRPHNSTNQQPFKFLKALHITVLDLKPPTLAKLLILLGLFAQYHASKKSNEDVKVRHNLICAMVYIFIAVVYPPFVHDVVQQSLGRLIDAMEAGTPVCSWVYVPEHSRAPILHYLKQWQGPAAEAYSNSKRLRDISARQIAMSEQAEAMMVNILAPPKNFDSGDGPELRKLLDSVKGNPKKAAANLKSLDDYISATWKTNVTWLDLDWERQWKEDSSPFNNPDEMHSGLRFNAIQVVAAVSRDVQSFKGKQGNTISRLAGFFAESAEAAIELVESASLVIEVICGEVAEVMERLQYDCYEGRAVGTASATAGSDNKPQIQGPDPSKFPKTFDRIHLSNIPDYVGGPLNPFLFARPLLKPLPDVSVWFNNLLNCTSFADMDQFNAEYTLLPNESLISKQFQLKRQPSPPGVQSFVQEDYMKWDMVHPTGSPLPSEKLPMSRPQLEKWLHAWFLKICLPYPRGQREGYAIHSPFNLTVLLRLMAHLHEVAGYPAHWLAGILRTVCSDSLTTTARPPVRLITTVEDLKKTYPPKKMNISPYNAELTTLVGHWRPLFEFGFALPQEQTVSPQDVVECKVLFKGGFKGDDGLRMSRFMILLWNKSLLGKPPATLRGLLSGEDANSAKILEKKGMHVVSTFAYSVPAQTALFWLRTDVVDRVMEDSIVWQKGESGRIYEAGISWFIVAQARELDMKGSMVDDKDLLSGSGESGQISWANKQKD